MEGQGIREGQIGPGSLKYFCMKGFSREGRDFSTRDPALRGRGAAVAAIFFRVSSRILRFWDGTSRTKGGRKVAGRGQNLARRGLKLVSPFSS